MDINFFFGVFQSSSKMKIKKNWISIFFVSPVAEKVKKKIYMYIFFVGVFPIAGNNVRKKNVYMYFFGDFPIA